MSDAESLVDSVDGDDSDGMDAIGRHRARSHSTARRRLRAREDARDDAATR